MKRSCVKYTIDLTFPIFLENIIFLTFQDVTSNSEVDDLDCMEEERAEQKDVEEVEVDEEQRREDNKNFIEIPEQVVVREPTNHTFNKPTTTKTVPNQGKRKVEDIMLDQAMLVLDAKRHKKLDADELFAQSIGESLKSIPDRRFKEYVKVKIQELVFQAQFGLLSLPE